MRKTIALSLVGASMLYANSNDLGVIEVQGSIPTAVAMDNISGEELQSADLAEALGKKNANIFMVRGSGIANDIILRGQKKDNINILIDNAKIHGACPNRMDPPTAHIETNNVDSVTVIEGPYDVENFGTLSGLVKIDTIKPTQEFSGAVNLNAGSFGYKKIGATASGGNDWFKILLGASYEESDQYKDGDGNTFAQQLIKQGAPMGNRYKASEANRKGFEKKTFMIKTFFDIQDNQELRLGYKRAEADKVLYPSRPMDADYDDSNIYTLGYSIFGLGAYSKQLDFEFYRSDVDHPMSTRYRNVSNTAPAGIVTNHLKTKATGAKVKNSFDIGSTQMSVGLDTSKRNWNGGYSASNLASAINGRKSINDVDTKNKALFTTAKHQFDDFIVEGGMRYDDTDITHGGNLQDNDYSSLNGYAILTYLLSDSTDIFFGGGKSSRVPDANELYFQNNTGAVIGTPNLKQTKNYETNLGLTHRYSDGSIKVKTFYSKLDDYIYFTNGNYTNIDAKVYGLDILGSHTVVDNLYFDYALSYLRGKKRSLPTNNTDKDLADIPPLKALLGLSYDFGFATLSGEVVSQRSWKNYDSDNGEQRLSGSSVFNLKYNHFINKSFDITLGINNLFDKTYTTSNTYNDLNLVGLTGSTERFLINEPGRYGFVNLRYSF